MNYNSKKVLILMFSFHDRERCQDLYFNQYIHSLKLKIAETGFLCILFEILCVWDLLTKNKFC